LKFAFSQWRLRENAADSLNSLCIRVHTNRKDPEEIPSPTLDSFFATAASLRSDHGVPIGIVAIDAVPGGLGDRLSRLRDPSLRGTAGVVARDLFVPSPQVQLGKCLVLLDDHHDRRMHSLLLPPNLFDSYEQKCLFVNCIREVASRPFSGPIVAC